MSFSRFPVRFGKYIILDRIKAGGMAEVYRAKEAHESGIAQLVAIKRMATGASKDPTMEPMFVDEAKLASRLVHPNIAQTYELGRIDDSLYIAMELVWGRDLNAIIKSCRTMRVQLPHALACYFVSKAAEALEHAHNATGPDGRPMRLVHRDVSPHNVMVDYEGEIKLIDFGIAKADMRRNETVAGVIKGKFSYMAPEQATGSAVDRRVDIFALGILLYELLSGERAFDGSSAFSIFEKVTSHDPPRLRDVAVVPEALDAIVSRCLAKNPVERFETAAQLCDALAPFRIVNQSIVGRREARELMQQLFPGDLASMQERLRSYKGIESSACLNANSSGDPIPRTEILVAADFIPAPTFKERDREAATAPLIKDRERERERQREREREAATMLYDHRPPRARSLAPETIPIPIPKTMVVELAPARWPTVVAIVFIALVATAIIIAARARNETAEELFQRIWRTYASAKTETLPTLDTSTLVGPKQREQMSDRRP